MRLWKTLTVLSVTAFVAAALAVVPAASPATSRARRVSPPYQWTTSPLMSIPSAADGVAVTPSSSSFTNSAWFEITPSTPRAWLMTGVVIHAFGNIGYMAFDVGRGAAGSETVIASGNVFALQRMPGRFQFGVPIDVPFNSRVSIRMRKNGGDTTTWRFALQYYEAPVAGYVVSTTAATQLATTSVLACGTSGSYGSYQQISASLPGVWSVSHIGIFTVGPSDGQLEIQLATGGSGSEVPGTAVHAPTIAAAGGGNYAVNLYPVFGPLAAGTRLSWRCRTSSASGFNVSLGLVYYEDMTATRGSIDYTRTLSEQRFYPADGTVIALAGVASDWQSTAWTELDPSTSGPLTLSNVTGQSAVDTSYECSVGTGMSGSEVPVATWRRYHEFLNNIQDSLPGQPLMPPHTIPAGTRLAFKCAAAGGGKGGTSYWSIGYHVSPDMASQTTLTQAAYPSLGNAVVTPSGTAWALSGYMELVSSTAADVLLTQLAVDGGSVSTETEYEAVIAVGAAGSEVPITTIRGRWGRDTDWTQLPAAHAIPAGSRISIALRKAGTTTNTWRFAVSYLVDSGLSAPANTTDFPAIFLMNTPGPWTQEARR